MTKDERQFQQAVREVGCIICKLFLRENSIAEIHHMLKNGRRRGEKYVLPMCTTHHRGGLNGKVSQANPMGIMSRDHSQRRFEKHYGMTEDEMLNKVKELIRKLP